MAFTWQENLSGIIYQDVLDEIKDNTDYLWDNIACITHDTVNVATQHLTNNGTDHSNHPNNSYDGDDGD